MDINYDEQDALRTKTLNRVRQDPQYLAKCDFKFTTDQEIVLAAICKEIKTLSFASANLLGDADFMLEACKIHPDALSYASVKLKNNYILVHSAVTSFGMSLQHASENLQGSSDIVMAAVNEDGMAIQFASSEMRTTYHIALTALQSDGEALMFLPSAFRNDEQMVLTAIGEHCGRVMEHASTRLKRNSDFVFKAVAQDSDSLQFVSQELQKNMKLIRVALNTMPLVDLAILLPIKTLTSINNQLGMPLTKSTRKQAIHAVEALSLPSKGIRFHRSGADDPRELDDVVRPKPAPHRMRA